MPSPTSDALEGLARDALGGDREHVERFLLAISPTVRRVCRHVLGRSHPDLEDTIQDCLIDILRALRSYRFEGAVLHYVTKIALRRSIQLRRRAAARVQQLRFMEQRPDRIVIVAHGTQAIHPATTLGELLRGLPRSQSQALILRVVLGFSVDEIAAITHASVNTVKTRLRLGKNALRRLLSSYSRPRPRTSTESDSRRR